MEVDCPTFSTLYPPTRMSAYATKMHHMDSITYVMCDECGLIMTTDKYTQWVIGRKEEE